MTALVRYEAARSALAAAKSVDEVKDMRDKAEAMRAYARQANNKELEVDAAEIRLRAERRLGQMLAEQKKTVGMQSGARGRKGAGTRGSKKEPHVDAPPMLSEAGIDKKLSARAQKLAAVPEEKLEELLGDWRDKVEIEGERVTTKLLHEGEKRQQRGSAEALGEPALATDRYGTIVIDPPWPMQKIAREVRPNQVGFDYPTMSEEQMAEFDVPGMAADDCHLFMWTTQKFLPMALRLLEPWGFKYCLTMVWHKPGGYQPVGLPQYNCEFSIYARKGSPSFETTKAFNVCFEAPRREHSRKPDEFYDLIRRVTADGRIDVFSREKRDGFDQWGNQNDYFREAG
jgi:N6-adenosine-specific RNA methylase IME4